MNVHVQMSAASNELDPGSDVDEPMASVSKVGLNIDHSHLIKFASKFKLFPSNF
jgi:hypothetical protein